MKTQSSVLLIDDEQIVCDSCHRILTNEGYKVETYTNPKEGYDNAINKLSTGKGNLVKRTENLKILGAKAKKQIPEKFIEKEENIKGLE